MPIYKSYGIGDPSSYQGAHPSLGGVSDRANFHAKACFCFFFVFLCFEMLIFTSFWEVVFFLTPPFLGGAQILQKLAVPTFWIFWLTGKRRADVGHVGRRRADVGQTSGRRRAWNVGHGTSGMERRANVGQTSGELKVVKAGKIHLQKTFGTEVEKLKKRNHFWTGEGQR